MGCTDKQVCLRPGVNAYEMTDSSAGKVCLGQAPFAFTVTLLDAQTGAAQPAAADPSAIFLQTYKPARLNNMFIASITNAAGAIIPREEYDDFGFTIAGFWYEGDNWMASVPEDQTPQTLVRGIPFGALDCENYVRCYGNPIPTNCLPTFKSNEAKAAITFGVSATAPAGPYIVRGQVVLDYGMVPLSQGKCYMENNSMGIDPLRMAAAQAAMTTTQGGR